MHPSPWGVRGAAPSASASVSASSASVSASSAFASASFASASPASSDSVCGSTFLDRNHHDLGRHQDRGHRQFGRHKPGCLFLGRRRGDWRKSTKSNGVMWTGIASSGEGNVLLASYATAAEMPGEWGILRSRNWGGSWADSMKGLPPERPDEPPPPVDTQGFVSAASSSNGQNLAMLGGDMYVPSKPWPYTGSPKSWPRQVPPTPWVSSEHWFIDWAGAGWPGVPSAGRRLFRDVAVSADGKITALAAMKGPGDWDKGALLSSPNSGASWAVVPGTEGIDWTSIAMSADGKVITAARSDGSVWTSSNAGQTFTEAKGVAAASLVMSADGKRQYALSSGFVAIDATGAFIPAYPGSAYLSTDSGQNWSRLPPEVWAQLPKCRVIRLTDVASSADGLQLALTTGASGADENPCESTDPIQPKSLSEGHIYLIKAVSGGWKVTQVP